MLEIFLTLHTGKVYQVILVAVSVFNILVFVPNFYKPIVMRSFDTATDMQLISIFKKGNDSALEALIKRHKDSVFTTILFLVKDEHLAEDIFQEVFFKIVDKLRSNVNYNEEGKFLSWALRVAHNLCIDHFRKVNTIEEVAIVDTASFENYIDTGNYADRKINRSQSHEKLRNMLNYLPSEQREIIVLRFYADLSFKEIASLTGTSINTALGRMRYALLNLRKMITEYEIVL